MMPEKEDQLREELARQPYPILFATVSGAHLYGFPSPDSDVDLRGVHLLPLRDVVGLGTGRETIEGNRVHDGREIDLVTYDLKRFCELLLKKNGAPLEQVYSPLVVATSPMHGELRALAQGCITRHHSHHYAGFAETQWRLLLKESPRRVKPLLYVIRVLLTGQYLMHSGEVEANLGQLNELYQLPYVPDLIARKLAGPERAVLDDADLPFYQAEYERLSAALEEAHQASTLPEGPSQATKKALNDLLVRVRLQ